METIKVNMSPNPLDVQTIHASQNDGEAREWEFELHNNGDVIDASEISDQLVFKAYKGGTEQILPENGSTPTTSPFKGDIKYPKGLLAYQEFTYRQSPTESDGLAKITDIKGNTLNWNQLVQNGNFADISLWRTYASTGFSVSNNVGSFTVTGATGAIYQTNTPTYVSGHKYLVIADFYVSQQANISVEVSGTRGQAVSVNANTWYRYSDIVTPSAQGNFSLTCGQASVQVKNVMCFDITKMGLDITDPSDFTSLFPFSYYAYNQGSLLSFMGNGIKTVGKNLFQNNAVNTTLNGITFTINDDKSVTVNGTATGNAGLTRFNGLVVPNIKKGESLILSGSLNRPVEQAYIQLVYKGDETGQTYSFVSVNNQSVLINATENMTLDGVYLSCRRGNTFNNETFYPMLRYANTDSTFEPYTSSTLSLPISTYFPTGMKSAGNVYDELTENKAITRIGSITLNGSEAWVKSASYPGNYYVLGLLSDVKYPGPNAISNSLILVYNTTQLSANDLCFMFDGSAGSYNVNIKNTSMTTLDQFKAWLQANPVTIYYELKTPTETPITTASLVTENAEIPLSNNDGVLIGKCTEQLSENPGFFNAKIKLADADGECYSNKVQLHVERSPQ